VGIEDVRDIIADLDQALTKSGSVLSEPEKDKKVVGAGTA
jgi:hypothetical protein